MATLAAASTPEPVEALMRFNEIVTRYCESQMFFAACRLGIFDQLAPGPATATDLAARLRLHPDSCRRLLAGLHQLGLLHYDAERYSNTALAAYATSAAPVPMEPLSMWGSLFYPMWAHLDDAVRERAPRWQQTFGATQEQTFANLYQDPAALRRFCALMSAYSIPQGILVAESFDFAPYRCILDVAGGPGGLIIEIGKRHPHLHGIVMDLPPVCEIADQAIRGAGLAGASSRKSPTSSPVLIPPAPTPSP